MSEVSNIAGLSAENIFTIYKKMSEIFERTENLDNDSARKVLKNLFTEMAVEINMLPCDESSTLTQVILKYITDFNFNFYTPILPDPDMCIIDASTQWPCQAAPTSMRDTEPDLTFRTSIEDFAPEQTFQTVKTVLNEDTLFRIVWRANVLSGTDVLVHKFLCDYIDLLQRREELFDDLDLRVYIVPT
jgi:hypothetical protein